MAYLAHHHGIFWFQIRVPRPLTACYGQLIRQNLQTTDRAVAQALAFQLAGKWLPRFSRERMSCDETVHAAGNPGLRKSLRLCACPLNPVPSRPSR